MNKPTFKKRNVLLLVCIFLFPFQPVLLYGQNKESIILRVDNEMTESVDLWFRGANAARWYAPVRLQRQRVTEVNFGRDHDAFHVVVRDQAGRDFDFQVLNLRARYNSNPRPVLLLSGVFRKGVRVAVTIDYVRR